MPFTEPSFDRLMVAVRHGEPDRVPLIEAAIDYQIMSQFLGKEVREDDIALQVEFWLQAGYDYIPLTVGMMEPGMVTSRSPISAVIKERIGSAGSHDESSWNLEQRSFIHTEADFEDFPWEEAARLDLSKFYEVQKYLPHGMRIIALSGKIFTLGWLLMGFENFAVSLALNPQLVSKVVNKVAEIQLDGLRQVANLPNVAAAWAVDDIAFGSGPIIRPKDFYNYVFPHYEEFGRICRDHSLLFFFHSDGVLWELIDDLIGFGVDALHPIDPTCMDIEDAKKRVGDRLCVMGNISNDLLMTGTPDEVAYLTKQRLKTLGPGGGYCLGSGNSVPSWAKIENYRAMIETGLQFGRYPIRID
jgi:uroporphyrinogen decarboxylase